MKDLIKLIIGSGIYFVAGPLLGMMLAKHRVAERALLCVLVTMPSWFPSKLTLMVDSIELYRGHTKGFEFCWMVFVGIALTVCSAQLRPPGYRLFAPGLWLYLLWCGLCLLSIVRAGNPVYVLMATWKFTSAAMVFLGAYHAFRDEADLKWVLRALAVSLVVQTLVCLKLRYLEGRWQVHGWFEHQNPMCIWAYVCAIPVMAVSFSPFTSKQDTFFFLVTIAGTALMILLAVSRGGLGAFVAGCAAVTGLAFLRGFSIKKLGITALGACAAVAAGMLAMDSLYARIAEVKSNGDVEDLRPVLNRMCKAMLHDFPTGVGWNNFGIVNSLPDERYTVILSDWDASRGFRIIDDNYFANPLTESLYWLWLAETGYQGFISFLAFLALTLWWGVRGVIRHWKTQMGYFVGGVVVALALLYLHGSVERVLSQTKNLSIWLIFAGFLARVELMRRFKPALARARPNNSLAPSPAMA